MNIGPLVWFQFQGYLLLVCKLIPSPAMIFSSISCFWIRRNFRCLVYWASHNYHSDLYKRFGWLVIPHLLKTLKDLPSPWQQTFNFLLQLRTSYFCLPSPISLQVILEFIYSRLAHIPPILSLSSWHQASCIPVSLTKATTLHLHHYYHLLVLTVSLSSWKCWYHHLQLSGRFQMCYSPHLPASTMQLLMCDSSLYGPLHFWLTD